MKYISEITYYNPKERFKSKTIFNSFLQPFLYSLTKLFTRQVKSYIFVASTGRSGTNTLSALVEGVESINAFHEPFPIMYTPESEFPNKSHYFKELFRIKKRVFIRFKAIKYSHYFETNHQFIKNFSNETVNEFSNKLKVIHLLREPIKVAQSFLEINSIPGKSVRGKAWLLDPKANDNIISVTYDDLAKTSEELDYLHCVWYWFETQARCLAFKLAHPQVPVVEIRTEDFNDIIKLKAFMTKLDLDINPEHLSAVCGKRENTKKVLKKKILEPQEYQHLYGVFYQRLTETVDLKYIYNFYS